MERWKFIQRLLSETAPPGFWWSRRGVVVTTTPEVGQALVRLAFHPIVAEEDGRTDGRTDTNFWSRPLNKQLANVFLNITNSAEEAVKSALIDLCRCTNVWDHLLGAPGGNFACARPRRRAEASFGLASLRFALLRMESKRAIACDMVRRKCIRHKETSNEHGYNSFTT